MRSIGRQAFDRGDRSIYRRDLRLASPSGLAANLYSAGTALADAASELRSLHVENVSEYPEEGHIWRCIYRLGLPVYGQFVGHITNLLEKRIERCPVALHKEPTGNRLVEGRVSPKISNFQFRNVLK